MIGQPNVCTFFGAVGADANGKTLADSATSAGVNVKYQIVEDHPTGTCAALITGTNRSLCAYLAAANHFTKSHLDKADNFALVEKARFYYITGFFLTVSPESLQTVAEYAAKNSRPFVFNLSAPFICEFFTERVVAAMPYVDILFGNETEARAYAKTQNFKGLIDPEDVTDIALKIANLEKANSDRKRIVVFTQGSDPVIVVQGNRVLVYPVTKLPAEKIKDTNGAGDAFVGGFLSQYIQGKHLDTCVEGGIWAAAQVIQNLGCTFPKKNTFEATPIRDNQN